METANTELPDLLKLDNQLCFSIYAASRAITTASPGAAVSRIRKERPRADRHARTRSIRFTTLGPAAGLWITSIIRSDYRIL